MEKETLPQFGWLFIGLFAMGLVSFLLNQLVLRPAGLPEEYQVITTIAGMAPVLIYVGIWYGEDRQEYWEHTRAHILGDLLFIVTGAAIGASIVLLAIVDIGLSRILQEVIAMAGGFLAGWSLFWWRNTELYRNGGGR